MAGEDSMRSPAARADTRLTYDDFVLFPVELELYLRSHPHAGEVFPAPLDVVLSHYDIVEPDLLVVAGDQTDILTERNVQGAPALVIEVLSKSTRKRDAQTKRRLFERTGVREYWLVDPELDAVQAFRPSPEGKLARVVELTSEDGDTLTTPLLPGCAIDLCELFRESP